MVKFLVFLFLGFFFIGSAQATFISPGRIIIRDGQKAITITIFNRSDEAKIYTFDWERRVMNPDGTQFVLEEGQVPPPGYIPADEFLVYSPRQVLVEPRGKQVLRLLARRPKDLPDGESRSNLVITPRPVQIVNDNRDLGGQGFSGLVKVVTIASVPVFVQTGDAYLNVDLQNINVYQENGKQFIRFNIINDSNRHSFMRHNLVCERNNQEPYSLNLTVQRLYPEAKNVVVDQEVSEDFPSFSSCAALRLELEDVINRHRAEPYKVYAIQ